MLEEIFSPFQEGMERDDAHYLHQCGFMCRADNMPNICHVCFHLVLRQQIAEATVEAGIPQVKQDTPTTNIGGIQLGIGWSHTQVPPYAFLSECRLRLAWIQEALNWTVLVMSYAPNFPLFFPLGF